MCLGVQENYGDTQEQVGLLNSNNYSYSQCVLRSWMQPFVFALVSLWHLYSFVSLVTVRWKIARVCFEPRMRRFLFRVGPLDLQKKSKKKTITKILFEPAHVPYEWKSCALTTRPHNHCGVMNVHQRSVHTNIAKKLCGGRTGLISSIRHFHSCGQCATFPQKKTLTETGGVTRNWRKAVLL